MQAVIWPLLVLRTLQYMKNNIELMYRSVTRPIPLWTEPALFGGYQYLELTPGVWCSRVYEYLLQAVMNEPQSSPIYSYALNALQDTSIYFYPSEMQLIDRYKLKLLLSKNPVFSVQGYSLAAEEFFSTLFYTTIYSDANYALPNLRKISTKDLCQKSSHILTLVNYNSTSLKGSFPNWGNIIVYDANTFDDKAIFSLGGDKCGNIANYTITKPDALYKLQ